MVPGEYFRNLSSFYKVNLRKKFWLKFKIAIMGKTWSSFWKIRSPKSSQKETLLVPNNFVLSVFSSWKSTIYFLSLLRSCHMLVSGHLRLGARRNQSILIDIKLIRLILKFLGRNSKALRESFDRLFLSFEPSQVSFFRSLFLVKLRALSLNKPRLCPNKNRLQKFERASELRRT